MKFNFLDGVLLTVCIMAMRQDYMGKEAYLEYASEQWLATPWWIWFIPILISAALAAFRKNQDNEAFVTS